MENLYYVIDPTRPMRPAVKTVNYIQFYHPHCPEFLERRAYICLTVYIKTVAWEMISFFSCECF